VTLVADIPLRGAGGEPVDFARRIASHGVAELPPNCLDLEVRVLETTLPIPRGARTIRLTERRGKLPIDRYARGDLAALDPAEKKGALLFFGRGGCIDCHSVSGNSNEMFSDFKQHAIAVPQLVPELTNNQFDGPAANEDFGRENFTGDPADRYQFRTPSLRNVAVEADYMHDGAYTTLAAAIRHHLDARAALLAYNPTTQDLPTDLTGAIGPTAPLLTALDPLLAKPTVLTASEFDDLVAFVRDALLDRRATPANLRKLIPRELPSGRPTLIFELGSQKYARPTAPSH
jgi:cytochrome c peroxidase